LLSHYNWVRQVKVLDVFSGNPRIFLTFFSASRQMRPEKSTARWEYGYRTLPGPECYIKNHRPDLNDAQTVRKQNLRQGQLPDFPPHAPLCLAHLLTPNAIKENANRFAR